MKHRTWKQSVTHPAGWGIAILLGLSYLGFRSASHPDATYKLDNSALSTSVDAVITNVRVQQFNAEGERVQWLTAPFVEHVPLDNRHTIHQPHIQVKQTQQPLWDLQADMAKAVHGGQDITFQHHVKLSNIPVTNTPPSQVTTETLTYLPQQQQAHTTSDVFFQQAGKKGHTKGLFAELAHHRLHLLEDVAWDDGMTHLRAHHAITQGDDTHPLLTAVIHGQSSTPVHFWKTASSHQPETHAHATRMTFDQSTQILELLGQAKLTQEGQLFSAPMIRYDVQRQHMISMPTAQARTLIVLHPREKT